MKSVRIGLSAAGTLSALISSSAEAQEHGDLASSQRQEIVVTAQFVEQDPIDVPIALTVFSGEDLERLGVKDFEELARFTPGFQVSVQAPNDPSFVLRGISSDIGPAFTEARVSVFQDGVSISKARGAFVELFDLERVEVVKGPQSTLYGRSALIGAVNVIQNKARIGETSGRLRAEYGNFDHILGEAAVNLPIADSAALRLAGRVRKRDGIVGNLGGGRAFGSGDTWAVRGALKFEPSDRVTLDVIGNYQHDEPTGTPFVSLAVSQTDPVTGAVLAPASPYGPAWLGFGEAPLGVDRDVYGVTGLAEFRLGDALTLNSVTAWRQFRVRESLDPDGISLPVLLGGDDASGRQVSQDLRLRWDSGGSVSAFVGASYFHQRGWQRTPAVFDEMLTLAQVAGALNGRIPGRPANQPAPLSVLHDPQFAGQLLTDFAAARGVTIPLNRAEAVAANLATDHRETTTNYSRTNAWDIFADTTVRLASRLELDLGARYSHDAKRSAISGAVLNGRSILGGYIASLTLPSLQRIILLNLLSVPGAAMMPQSDDFPLPMIGLGGQPTINNGDIESSRLSDNGVSFRAIARFTPTPDSSLYAAYARGRRPAELSARPPSFPFDPARFESVRAETVDSFEVGAKASLFDQRLYLDAALFHYQYRNFQTTERVGVLFVTTNAGKARSTGLEAQFRYSPSDWLELFGSYAWNHSRFRSGVRRGNHFRLSPDHSAALGVFARMPLDDGEVSFTPSVTWQSKVWFDSDNDRPDLQQPPNTLVADNLQDEVQGPFALVNVRLGYAPGRGRWRIEAFVENLLDRKYLRDAGNVGDYVGLATGVRGNPRTFGVSLRMDFDHAI